MKIIAGLGNPGQEYSETRHNVGFMMVDALAGCWQAGVWQEKFSAQIAEVFVGAEKILLVKPQTYMNNSGEAIGALLRWYKLGEEDLIVIYDDMDIPAGTMRLRKKGSSGGHNGIKSILQHTETEDFARVRIGIGRPLPGWTVVNHVLAKFPPEDKEKVQTAIEGLIPAIACIAADGIDLAMNRFNPKKVKKAKVQPQENTATEQETAAPERLATE